MTAARIYSEGETNINNMELRTEVIRMWVRATCMSTGMRISWACLIVTSVKLMLFSCSRDAVFYVTTKLIAMIRYILGYSRAGRHD